MTSSQITELSKRISQFTEKKTEREEKFAQIQQMLDPMKMHHSFDFFDQDHIRSLTKSQTLSKNGIGMQFDSSYNYNREHQEGSDSDLEYGLKPSSVKTPNMELLFASSAKKESRSSY
jgi:hypothetical protein